MDILKATPALLEAIKMAAPAVKDISIGVAGVPASVKVFPADQQVKAQEVIDSFDWENATPTPDLTIAPTDFQAMSDAIVALQEAVADIKAALEDPADTVVPWWKFWAK